jgi:hypothetical protein
MLFRHVWWAFIFINRKKMKPHLSSFTNAQALRLACAFLISTTFWLSNCDDETKDENHITLNQLPSNSSSVLVAGSKDQVLLGVKISSDVATVIQSFVITLNEPFRSKLTNVRIFSSPTESFSIANNNSLLVTIKDSTSTSILVSLNQTLSSNSINNYFVVANINSTVSSVTKQLIISTSSSSVSLSSGSITAPVNVSSQYTFKEKTSELSVVKLSNISPGPLQIGSYDAALLGFSISSQTSPIITAFTIRASSKIYGKFYNFRLMRSGDSDYLTPNDNVVVVPSKIDTTGTAIIFSGLQELISNTSKNYFVVADVGSATALQTATFQLSFSGTDVTASTGTVPAFSITGPLFSFLLPTAEKGNVYIGVTGFNSSVKTSAVTKDANVSKSFINTLVNDVDATALCYGISKGIDLLKEAASNSANPNFDYSYIVSFTDGYDNYSANFFPGIFQDAVVPYTKNLLSTVKIDNKIIKSYTIGFQGTGVVRDQDLRDLAVNGGYSSATATTLQKTFEDIANKVLSTAKNVSLVTNAVPISKTNPKLIQITIKASTSPAPLPPLSTQSTFIIEGSFYNEDAKTPVFQISKATPGVTFDTEIIGGIPTIKGMIEDRSGVNKAIVPLKNLNISALGQELFMFDNIQVMVKYKPTDTYTTDVEDSKAETLIPKNIAVILVLDCSLSLGTRFADVKTFSIDFINKLNSK